MTRATTALLTAAFAAFVLLGAASAASAADRTKCRMVYDLDGWGVFYETSRGTGKITCENGQSMNVRIVTHGGGPTLGTYQIDDGRGTFSSVRHIDDLLGTYVEAGAHAAAGAGGGARAMFKGNVSLSLAGTGTGINLGISLGAFRIEKQ